MWLPLVQCDWRPTDVFVWGASAVRTGSELFICRPGARGGPWVSEAPLPVLGALEGRSLRRLGLSRRLTPAECVIGVVRSVLESQRLDRRAPQSRQRSLTGELLRAVNGRVATPTWIEAASALESQRLDRRAP